MYLIKPGKAMEQQGNIYIYIYIYIYEAAFTNCNILFQCFWLPFSIVVIDYAHNGVKS
jgi:hypothetical protein